LGGVVPGCAEGADEALEGGGVPLGAAGHTVVIGVEVGFVGGTGALGSLLVEGEVVGTSDTLLVGEVPGGRFGTGDAFACCVDVVVALTFALLGGSVPGLVGLARVALKVGVVPLSVAGLADIVGVEVGFLLGTHAL